MIMESQEVSAPPSQPLRVLLIDRDRDVLELIQAVLTDEGYEVTAIAETDHEAIAAAVGRVEPDCILLDGATGLDFGRSWASAAYLATRERAVPTVMCTAHTEAAAEAQQHTSDRAIAAGFAAIVTKPFEIDALLEAVDTATGRSVRFDRSEAGDQQRTAILREELRAAGATDIRTGERREWATFVPPGDDRIHQLYWWQGRGFYIVGRYDGDARLEMLGRHYEREAAVRAATTGVGAPSG
jgi:CheY-like chemotaxis protein